MTNACLLHIAVVLKRFILNRLDSRGFDHQSRTIQRYKRHCYLLINNSAFEYDFHNNTPQLSNHNRVRIGRRFLIGRCLKCEIRNIVWPQGPILSWCRWQIDHPLCLKGYSAQTFGFQQITEQNLKIPKGKSEAASRSTGNAIIKKTNTNIKIVHRKLKIEQHEVH